MSENNAYPENTSLSDANYAYFQDCMKGIGQDSSLWNKGFNGSQLIPFHKKVGNFLFGGDDPKNVRSKINLHPMSQYTQVGHADCVGAMAASVISTVTGSRFSENDYCLFLKAALINNLAFQTNEGTQVKVEILSFITSPFFQRRYPKIKASIGYDVGISIQDVTSAITKISGMRQKISILCPVSSWNTEFGSHIVALQNIDYSTISFYDPASGTLRKTTYEEFERHRNEVNQSAINIRWNI